MFNIKYDEETELEIWYSNDKNLEFRVPNCSDGE